MTSGEKIQKRLVLAHEAKRKITFEIIETSPPSHATHISEKLQVIPISVSPTPASLLVMKADFSRDTSPELMKHLKQSHVDMMHDLVSVLHKLAKGDLQWPTMEDTCQIDEGTKMKK